MSVLKAPSEWCIREYYYYYNDLFLAQKFHVKYSFDDRTHRAVANQRRHAYFTSCRVRDVFLLYLSLNFQFPSVRPSWRMDEEFTKSRKKKNRRNQSFNIINNPFSVFNKRFFGKRRISIYFFFS